VDFEEVFAPVARIETVRLLIAIAVQRGWPVHHMDVKSAFLNGELREEVYVQQPPRFVVQGSNGRVLKLKKDLYGLRQTPRAWNTKLGYTLVGVYVDDLIITGSSSVNIVAFKEEMKRSFSMSDLGLLSYYLGIQVDQK
jgi:hypothetical protein